MVDENIFAALAPLTSWQRTEAAVLLRTVATFDTEYPPLLVPALMMGEHQESLN